MNPHRHRKGLGAALALLVTGCGQSSAPPPEAPPVQSQEQRAAYTPQFCAFIPNILECAPASQGPQAAYERIANRLANTCGSDLTCLYQVIKLWATPPQDGAPAHELQAWQDAQQQATDFLKNTNKSAEALLESLRAHSNENKSYIRDQERAIAAATDRVNTIVRNAETVVKQKASEYSEPVVLEAADVKAGMTRLEDVVASARAGLEALGPEVVALADRFRTYKGTESATTAELHALATQGSAANLQGLVTVQLDAVALAQQESGEASELVLEAMRLRTRLALLQEEYLEQLEPLQEFIAQRGLHMGDLVRGELQMLGGIEGYCDSRRRKVLSAVDRLLEGMKQRRDALIGLEANEATRQALADAAFLTASQRFLDDVTARSTQLWQVAPKSTRLKLSFLSAKYDQMESYLQFEPACAPPQDGARSWREAGCVAMRRDFSRVRTWMTSTLPGTLRLNVSMMRSAGGVPAALLTDVEAKLAAGQLKAAAVAHDAALNVSDGL
ncbi:hypothetical protein HPC49_22685 [Pyxidicoccus fallax]|uniref:Lipoprotein n=1 Tax=Pyxidicoccus fallax TaxID=394095 RepID=A0A848LRJ8_9BACT|nr:hypothetical protein [Pyxidicoccus fallax]NMO20262.1 hypothetical protein [Pyxidicoccus fallax]NPC81020.1 hypothetical protein [Pyxidicoccus fallax]